MTDSNELTTELDSMAIILHAGNAKSCAFEALKEVKQQNIEAFTQKITEAKDEIKLAHRAHAELLRKLSSENRMRGGFTACSCGRSLVFYGYCRGNDSGTGRNLSMEMEFI